MVWLPKKTRSSHVFTQPRPLVALPALSQEPCLEIRHLAPDLDRVCLDCEWLCGFIERHQNLSQPLTMIWFKRIPKCSAVVARVEKPEGLPGLLPVS